MNPSQITDLGIVSTAADLAGGDEKVLAVLEHPLTNMFIDKMVRDLAGRRKLLDSFVKSVLLKVATEVVVKVLNGTTSVPDLSSEDWYEEMWGEIRVILNYFEFLDRQNPIVGEALMHTRGELMSHAYAVAKIAHRVGRIACLLKHGLDPAPLVPICDEADIKEDAHAVIIMGILREESLKQHTVISPDRIPSEEEVRTILLRFVGDAPYTERRKLVNEEGVYLWELEVKNPDGSAKEFLYSRKGVFVVGGKELRQNRTTIDVTYWDEDGDLVTGYGLLYLNAYGKWASALIMLKVSDDC